MQLYIQRLKSYCLKFFKFLSYGSKQDKLGRFQNSDRRYKSLTYKLISPERSNHTIFKEKAEVAYRNLAVHISLNSIGRSFQWQLRRLNWINLFERSTNQPLFSAVFFPLNTRNTFDFSSYHLMSHVASNSCTAADLDARSSVVFWVSFSGISALFNSSHSLYITNFTALFGIISFL